MTSNSVLKKKILKFVSLMYRIVHKKCEIVEKSMDFNFLFIFFKKQTVLWTATRCIDAWVPWFVINFKHLFACSFRAQNLIWAFTCDLAIFVSFTDLNF